MQWEFDFLNYLQTIHNPVLDKIMVAITHLGDAGILWIALAIILLFIPKYRKIGLCMGVGLVLHLLIINISIKPLVARIRPYDVITNIDTLIKRPIDYSFPSGHTAASFVSAAVFFIYKNKYRFAVLALSILIAFSRLYLYVHYPTDVIFGIIIGILCAMLAAYIIKKVKFFNKLANPED